MIGIIIVWKGRKSKQHSTIEGVHYSTINEQVTTKNKLEATHSEVNDKQFSIENPQYMEIIISADSATADKVVMQDNPSYSLPSGDQVKLQDNPAYASSSGTKQ